MKTLIGVLFGILAVFIGMALLFGVVMLFGKYVIEPMANFINLQGRDTQAFWYDLLV